MNRGQMDGFLFDTNALNHFLDRGIAPGAISSGARCCVTAVQFSELQATSSAARRDALWAHFEVLKVAVPIQQVSLRSAPFGTSPFGLAPFGGGDGQHFKEMKRQLDEIGGNRSRRGNTADALTLEVCFYNRLTLVTDDPSLRRVAQVYGVAAETMDEFRMRISHENRPLEA